MVCMVLIYEFSFTAPALAVGNVNNYVVIK